MQGCDRRLFCGCDGRSGKVCKIGLLNRKRDVDGNRPDNLVDAINSHKPPPPAPHFSGRATTHEHGNEKMYALYDTFNNRIVSRHRTVSAAIQADERLQRSVKRNNSHSSYLPTELRTVDRDGSTERLDECCPEMEQWLCDRCQ